ncbi:glutathione S-transferase [Hesseltinella vesiculosa]|uniref:Glutathione S-transferase n=1 Tax=Hesseltinella vesiculosa TaxID=101127 RepID=A0A1X2GBE3_9FUNG|nr:glutathione S-transferase [Hesseltinella vesiculosa]
MSPSKLTLYNAKICPYAQRAVITLKEVGAEYEQVEIDLLNKPEWYTKDIYPEGKVPLLDVDGTRIPESLVIVELVNNLFKAKLFPEDPIKRAQIQVAIELFAVGSLSFQVLRDGISHEEYIQKAEAALERLNGFLLEQAASGPYFLGEEYSFADIAFAPIVARFLVFNKSFINGYAPAAVQNSTRLNEFFQGILSRPSFKESYIGDEEYAAFVRKRFNL